LLLKGLLGRGGGLKMDGDKRVFGQRTMPKRGMPFKQMQAMANLIAHHKRLSH